MSSIAEPEPLSSLWRRLGAMFARAGKIIGAAEALARLVSLERERRQQIDRWLGRLECVARKLLFAEAAALPREPLPPKRANPLTRNDRTRLTSSPYSAYDLSQPRTWPARFNLALPRDPLRVPQSRAPRIRNPWRPSPPPPASPARQSVTPPSMPATVRFAFRIEALRRVLADPMPYARRLARIFRRLARCFPEAALRYALAAAPMRVFDEADPLLIRDSTKSAEDAVPSLADTS